VDNLPLQVCSQIFLISPKLTPLFIDPDRIVSANWPDADHVFLVNALDLAILKKDAGAAELLLAHGARHSSFLRTDKFPFPIHDLLLCGPVNAPIDPAVTPEMMDMLISVFEASATGNMAEEEIAVVLTAAGLLSPLVEELAGQLCYGPQLKQAMAGSAPLTQAQIRQAVSGMLGELESYKISRPQPYRVPERRTVLAPDRLRTSTLVPWLSEEGQAHLTRSLDKQVQLLADLGRQTESDELGEGVWNLLDLCLQHLPVRSAANAAALRQALTGGLGLYGSLADKVLLAWLATLAELPAAGSAQTEAERILLGTFAHQLQAQLKGAVLYPQMRTTSAVNQMTMHVTTQLMIRQWTMLEQYWHGAAVAAAPAPSQ
jgi:hypothetical protein